MGVWRASPSGPDAFGASASRGFGVTDAAGSGRVLGVSLAAGAGAREPAQPCPLPGPGPARCRR